MAVDHGQRPRHSFAAAAIEADEVSRRTAPAVAQARGHGRHQAPLAQLSPGSQDARVRPAHADIRQRPRTQ